MVGSPSQQAEETEAHDPSDRDGPHRRTVLWTDPPSKEEAATWAPRAAARSREDMGKIRGGRGLRGKGSKPDCRQ
eukprot:2814767-Pyramimonas_sp.AAC.1